MKSIIISTCGHIDHGKTYLVEKLTNKNTMHTKEELKRSITIDLGYARCKIDDLQVNIIDVPGHKDYLKNTICGLLNSDFSILVVSATQGISAQSIQHFQSLELLKKEHLIIALTKIDLAQEEQIQSSLSSIKKLIKNSSIKDIRTVLINYKNENALDELKKNIYDISKKISLNINKQPIIKIDNSFSIKGIGTVISGNLISGTLNKNDKIYLHPLGKEIKIKSMQCNHINVDSLSCNNRIALNISNLKKDEAKRGDIISKIKNQITTNKIDAIIKTSDNFKSIKNYQDIKIYTGTNCINAKIVNIQKKPILPNNIYIVKLILKDTITCFIKDKILILNTSNNNIISGGIIINNLAKRKTTINFDIKNNDINSIIINHLINENKYITKDELNFISNIDIKITDEILNKLINNEKIKQLDEFYLENNFYKNLELKLDSFIKDYKQKNHLSNYIYLKFIFDSFEYLKPKLLKNFLNLKYEIEENKIIFKNKDLDENTKSISQNMIYIVNNSSKPLKIQQVTDSNKENTKILFTICKNSFIKLNEEYICSIKCIKQYKKFIIEHFEKNDKLNISDIKNKFELNRKQSLSILEYFDNEKITKRFENYRIKSYNIKD